MNHPNAKTRHTTTLIAMIIGMGGIAGLPQTAVAELSLIGGLINLPAAGPFGPDVEYSAAADAYLAIWYDVTDGWQCKGVRVHAETGAVLDAPFYISDNPATLQAIVGAVTYNSTNGEWLVVYQASQAAVDGGRNDVFGQRIAADGTKIGGHLELVRKGYWQDSAEVAHDTARNRYLVAWKHSLGTGNPLVIQAQLFTDTGSPAGNEIAVSDPGANGCYNPQVAYNPVVDEFLIVWLDYRNWPGTGQDNDYGDVYGQRVNAATGAKIGSNIPVYSPASTPPYVTNGQDNPNGITCNTTDGRYAIGITKLTAALGWTTLGLLVDATGTMIVPPINLSYPSFGAQCKPVYNPSDNTYYFSYEGPSNNVAGHQISPSGAVLRDEETIIGSIGGIRDNALAVRSGHGHYLQVAISDGGVYAAQRFATCEQVFGLAAASAHKRNALSWTNPGQPDFAGTIVRFRTDTFPTGPDDGALAVNKPGVPGASDNHLHTGLTNDQTYYYTAFAYYNTLPTCTPGTTAHGTPFLTGDFAPKDGDVDQADFGRFQQCLAGSGTLVTPGCEDADLDGDLDVDLDDFGLFQACMSGPNVDPGC
jgi:hypothetical protein